MGKLCLDDLGGKAEPLMRHGARDRAPAIGCELGRGVDTEAPERSIKSCIGEGAQRRPAVREDPAARQPLGQRAQRRKQGARLAAQRHDVIGLRLGGGEAPETGL